MTHPKNRNEEAFGRALGTAVLQLWSGLPQGVQEMLFEHAVVAGHQFEQNENFREEMAKYLHDHHERTLAAGTMTSRTQPTPGL